MARAGRKRKGVARHPCGKIVKGDRTPREDPAMSVVMLQRFKIGATRANVLDQRWGSELGILSLHGEISNEAYQAGCELATIAAAYSALGGFGSFNAQAADPERVRGYSANLGDPDVWAALKFKFDQAQANIKTVTFGLCVNDWPVAAGMVRGDLETLARLWHIALHKAA